MGNRKLFVHPGHFPVALLVKNLVELWLQGRKEDSGNGPGTVRRSVKAQNGLSNPSKRGSKSKKR